MPNKHPGRAITRYQVTTIFSSAYLKVVNAAKTVEGFKVKSIATFDPDGF